MSESHAERPAMKPYGTGRDTGVTAYETGDDFIRARFADGRVYVYDADRPGRDDVDRMKALAASGTGLTTYINQYVRNRYARREQ